MYRWGIRKVDSGRLLSLLRPGDDINYADFAQSIPVLLADARGAQEVWTRWLIANEYIARRITLPKVGPAYDILRPLPVVKRVRIAMIADQIMEAGVA